MPPPISKDETIAMLEAVIQQQHIELQLRDQHINQAYELMGFNLRIIKAAWGYAEIMEDEALLSLMESITQEEI